MSSDSSGHECSLASFFEMRALVEQGLGIAVLPDYFAQDSVRRRYER
jgi:hypothetical protein